MSNLRRIDDSIAVAPQIAPEDVAALASAGFRTIINNRPDQEDAGQPNGDLIAEACIPAGVRYYAIPITHAGFSENQIEAMLHALDEAQGKVLAFCRSGTRSCNLWALAAVSRGGDPDELTAKAAAAGYDISGIRPLLDQLSGRG